MDIWGNIDVAAVRVHSRCYFTNALFTRFLVSNGHSGRAGNRGDILRRGGSLPGKRGAGQRERRYRQQAEYSLQVHLHAWMIGLDEGGASFEYFIFDY